MSDKLMRAARTGSLSWIIALPVLAVGMMCFWAQRDALGMTGTLLKAGALLVPLSYVLATAVGDVAGRVRPGIIPLLVTVAKGLGLGVLGMVLGSLMLFVEALRPESAFAFFPDAFTTGHLIAAGIPSLIAAAGFAWSVWADTAPRRPLQLGVIAALALLGPAAWGWSAGVAFEAMRYANADNALLLAHAIALAALVVTVVANTALGALRNR